MQESKEKIKSRMIKNASRLWGYQDTQSESSFDPFVGMIIGSLAGELEKISGDISATESRVVEKLVELLTPEPITGPFPAHALIKAKPLQPNFTINSHHQFYTYKKKKAAGNHGKTEEKSIYFTPTASFKLFNGKLKFLANGKKLFEIQEEQYKEVFALSRANMPLPPSTLWMGLELNDEINSFEGLSLCFDLRNEMHQDTFYQSLSRGKWSINGNTIQVRPGYGQLTKTIGNELDGLLTEDMNICSKICNHVNHFYQKKFMSISNYATPDQLPQAQKFPPIFKETFQQEDLESIDRKLFWIKVELPEAFNTDILEDVYCTMNCFPAINRQLNDFTQSSREFINIIPLQTENAFLDMNSVTNTEGKTYSLKTLSGMGELNKGAYILRQGGVGRFDSRNAMEVLNYLLELLRDESAAFSVLGTDMISSNLRELHQTIARLEQRLKDSHVEKEDTSYLMLKAQPEDETVFVEFWSTQAAFANNIKTGTSLNNYEGSDIEQDSLVFVSPTLGGRERMDTEERINTYRKTLLSHGRIVTAEDIKALCYEHFGTGLEQVEVKKGIMKSSLVNQGFVRCIDIHIKLDKRKTAYEEEELKFLQEDLLVKLKEQSANVLPYRCFINNSQ